jgi:alpha-N-arabinofuranosidase
MAEPTPAPAARFVLDPAFAVGPVDPRLFGPFVEHLGRCVYTGVYGPATPPPTPTACAPTSST